MTMRKNLRVITGKSGDNARRKMLPAVDYSGEPTDADLKATRDHFETEVKDDNLKTVEGPAW